MDEIKSKVELDLSDLITQLDQIKGSFEDLVSIQERLGTTSQTNHDAQIRNLDAEYEIQKSQLEDIRARRERNAQAAKDRANNEQMRANAPRTSYEEDHGYDYMTDHKGRRKMLSGVLGSVMGNVAEAGVEGGLAGHSMASKVFNIPEKQPGLDSLGPYGAAINLMVAALGRSEMERSKTTQISNEFNNAGGSGLSQNSQGFASMRSEVKQLSIDMGAGPMGLAGEFANISKTFAAAGITGEQATKKWSVGAQGASRDLLRTSFDIDAMYKQASGTAAQQAVTIMADFGLSGKEASARLLEMGSHVKSLGASYSEFTDSVLKNAAALREQKVDLEDVMNVQLGVNKAFTQQMPGASRAYVNAASNRATGQLTGALANLDVGMASVIGERMNKGGGEPLAAYYGMKDAFTGGKAQDARFASQAIKEMGGVFKDQGMSDYEARFAMEKTYGISAEGSKAMLAISQAEGNNDHETADKLFKEHAKDLMSGEEKRGMEADQNSKLMQQLQQKVIDISMAMFRVLVDIGRLTGDSVQILMHPSEVMRGGEHIDAAMKDAGDVIKQFTSIKDGVVDVGNLLIKNGKRIVHTGESSEQAASDAGTANGKAQKGGSPAHHGKLAAWHQREAAKHTEAMVAGMGNKTKPKNVKGHG